MTAAQPADTSDKPMDTKAGCNDGGKNFRGAEKAPSGRTGTAYRSPVATYDAKTGKTTWADQDTSAKIAYDGGAAQLFGERLLEVDVAPAVAGRQPGVVLD